MFNFVVFFPSIYFNYMQTKRYINWKITICFPKVQFNKGVLPWPSVFMSPSCFLSPLLSLLDQCPQDLFKTRIPLHLYKNLLLEKQLRSLAIYSRTCLKIILGVSEEEREFSLLNPLSSQETTLSYIMQGQAWNLIGNPCLTTPSMIVLDLVLETLYLWLCSWETCSETL